VAWLVDALADADWRELFPGAARLADAHGDPYDYAAEDAWLAARHSGDGS
jgi:hypothetical protein